MKKINEKLVKIYNRDMMVFDCAMSHIGEAGVEACKKYDIEKMAAEIKENPKAILGKDFEIEILKTSKEIALNATVYDIMHFFELLEKEKHKKQTEEEINRVSFEIEHFNGSTYMGFELAVFEDGGIKVTNTLNCDIADTDEDYIFNTCNDLVRIQANSIVSEQEYMEIRDSYEKLSEDN